MNKMTIKKARFIARELKKAVFDRLAWWDLDGYKPTIKQISSDILTNPKAVDDFVLATWEAEFQADRDSETLTALEHIHVWLNHPEMLDLVVYYNGESLGKLYE